MFRVIYEKLPRDDDYPERSYTNDVYSRVLEGALYDHLPHPFHKERSEANEYIPLRERRPSVRYGLCRLVVDDSVALLFSEGHFPTADCDDEDVKESLAAIVKEAKLNETMLTAATMGSVGSAAIHMRVLPQKGSNTFRVFYEAHRTRFLTPTFEPNAPDTLAGMREQYKVKGAALRATGYVIDTKYDNAEFWFRRAWDDQEEIWYLPWLVKAEVAAGEQGAPITPAKDEQRSVRHGLGFVPWVWIRNLPGDLRLLPAGDNTMVFSNNDGACTFGGAIDDNIEIDYLLSQAGRGLKYNMDPLLLIKEPISDKAIIKDGSFIVTDEKGDGKMLEVEGTAFTVVIEFAKAVRELALESVHGNRTDANKLTAATSGRAMEMMNQALIWLADRLRVSYGEGALLSLLRMTVQAHRKFPLVVNGDPLPALPDRPKITLRWPRWYAPTSQDRKDTAETLKTHKESGHMSRETAVKTIAGDYDIEDPAAEIKRIEADQKAEVELLPAPKSQVKAQV